MRENTDGRLNIFAPLAVWPEIQSLNGIVRILRRIGGLRPSSPFSVAMFFGLHRSQRAMVAPDHVGLVKTSIHTTPRTNLERDKKTTEIFSAEQRIRPLSNARHVWQNQSCVRIGACFGKRHFFLMTSLPKKVRSPGHKLSVLRNRTKGTLRPCRQYLALSTGRT